MSDGSSGGNNTSKRGRKPLPAVEVVDANADDEAIGRAGAAASELVLYEEQLAENTRQVAQRLHYEGPLHPDLLEHGIRTELRRSVEACLAVGAMLVLIREQTPQGEFMQRLERLGIEERVARRFMQTSIKLANTSQRMREAIGSQSKAFELLVLDTEEIAALDEGGTVRGVTVDKIAAMGVREARLALREGEATLKAKDKLLKKKNAKIDQLSEQLERRASSEPAEREKAQLELLRADCLDAETALLRALVTIDQVMQEPASGAAELAARHSVDFIVRKFVDACNARAIGINLADPCSPIWYEEIKDMGAQGRAQMEAKAAARRGGKAS